MLLGQRRRSLYFKKWKSIIVRGRAVGELPGSIFAFLKLYGGIESRERYMSKRVLYLFEREGIYRWLSANLSIRIIIKKLKRASSTIFREINKNVGTKKYMAIMVDSREL